MSSIPQIPPTSGEPQQRFFGSDKKLSTPSIFDKIRPLMCSINSTVGESSGFFIGKGTILTVAHNIPMEKVEGKDRFTTDYVQIDSAHQHKPYFPKSSDGIVQEHAKALDLYAIEHEIQLSDLNEIPILSAEIPLKEGMKVYFAGYPLGQDTVTFHKGTISSITENQGIRRFTIDGTVVPGNSGGPVVIQHEGKIYLVGVITSEVAAFSILKPFGAPLGTPDLISPDSAALQVVFAGLADNGRGFVDGGEFGDGFESIAGTYTLIALPSPIISGSVCKDKFAFGEQL